MTLLFYAALLLLAYDGLMCVCDFSSPAVEDDSKYVQYVRGRVRLRSVLGLCLVSIISIMFYPFSFCGNFVTFLGLH